MSEKNILDRKNLKIIKKIISFHINKSIHKGRLTKIAVRIIKKKCD